MKYEQFTNEQEVIEAAFEANLRHGLRLTTENRSDYVYILHKHHPRMTQKELAERAHVRQSTVSEALARRAQREQQEHSVQLAGKNGEEGETPDVQQEQWEQSSQFATKSTEEGEAPDFDLGEEVLQRGRVIRSAEDTSMRTQTEEDRIRKEMQQTTRNMSREAAKLISFIQPLDVLERRNLMVEWLAHESIQERQALLSFAHLQEDVLEAQPKRRPPRRG